jgi:YfiH family protein
MDGWGEEEFRVEEIENREVARREEAGVVRVAGWKQYGWLRHGFSTRRGGISEVYGLNELNLGFTKEDDSERVRENRRGFRRAVTGEMGGEDGWPMVTLRQVHSATSWVVGRDEAGLREAVEGRLATAEGKAVLEGDGLVTGAPGVLLGVQTADCVPVLVVDVAKRVVGAFHAGWRGTVAGIVEQGVGMLGVEYGSRPEDMVAAVGPSIGACCYAVGDEVRGEFEARFGYARELFRTVGDSMMLDLWEANRRQLLEAGVAGERITVLGECSGCAGVGTSEGRRYYSHRMEKGFAGRMMSAVGIAG